MSWRLQGVVSRLLPRNQFLRSVSVLVGGTVAGQLLVVLASPLLTRLYSPNDFGILAIYMGGLAVLAEVASFRYQLAIPLTESERETVAVAALSAIVLLVMVVTTAFACKLFGYDIVYFLNAPEFLPHIWLLPVGLLFVGLYQILNYWAIKNKLFSAIAWTKFSQSASLVFVQSFFYFIGPLALLLGQIFGSAAGLSVLSKRTIFKVRGAFNEICVSDIKEAAIRWRHFPLYSSWGGLFNVAGVQLPPILFAALFSPAAAGIYMLSNRILNLPMQLIGQAVAQVFFSSAADAKRTGDLAPLVANLHARLAQMAMPAVLILILTGPKLFSLIFGQEWEMAGEFAKWMAPWLYLVFITSPLSMLTVVLERQLYGMIFQAALFFARAGGLFYGAINGDLIFAVEIFSIASAACWLFFLAWLICISGNTWTAVVVPTLKAFIVSVVLVFPIILSTCLGGDGLMWISGTLVSFVFIALYYFLILRKG